MKLFATADIHGNEKHLELIKETCIEEKVDALFIAGDIAPHCSGMNSIWGYEKAQNSWHNNTFNRFLDSLELSGISYAFILGNDDWYYINGNRHEYERLMKPDVRFFPYVNPCAGINVYSNRERNNNEQEYHLNHLGDCRGNIILAHAPPFGICDLAYAKREPWTFGDNVKEHIGSKAAYKFIQEQNPAIWLCGHCHEGYGMKIINVNGRNDLDGTTHVFNCACDKDVMRGWIIEYEDRKVLDYTQIVSKVDA